MSRFLFMNRREFSRSAAGIVGSLASLSAWGKTRKKSAPKSPLVSSDWATIGFLADEIVPKGENNLSASEANVVEYLKYLLADKAPRWRSRLLRAAKTQTPYLGHYRKLVDRLNAVAKERFQKAYAELEASQRASVTQAFAQTKATGTAYRVAGLAPAAEMADADLFSLARRHVMEGYLSDPRHGGNKDFQGWKAIGNSCNMHYPDPPENCPTHQIYPEG